MARNRKKALYALVEASYAAEPDADGSDYLPIPARVIGDLSDNLELIETNFFTGRDRTTTPMGGPDGASFDFETGFIGLATSAGNGQSPSAVDWFDTLLLHTFGAATSVNGVSITASTASTITGGVDVFNGGDVTMVHEAGYPAAAERGHAALVQSATSPWTISPAFPDAAGPGVGSVAYGSRSYRLTDAGGASLAFVYVEDDVQYTLLGCRITSFKISAEAGKEIRCMWSVRSDSKAITTKASLATPLLTSTPRISKLALSPVFYGSTNMGHVGSIEVDFGVNASVLASVNGTVNGRGGDESINQRPTATIDPPADSSRSHFTLKRGAANEGPGAGDELMIQLGRGFFGGTTALGAGCVSFPNAAAREVTIKDDSGRLRNAVTFNADDNGAAYAQAVLARF